MTYSFDTHLIRIVALHADDDMIADNDLFMAYLESLCGHADLEGFHVQLLCLLTDACAQLGAAEWGKASSDDVRACLLNSYSDMTDEAAASAVSLFQMIQRDFRVLLFNGEAPCQLVL